MKGQRLRFELRTCLALKGSRQEKRQTFYQTLEPKVERPDMHFPPFSEQSSVKWLAPLLEVVATTSPVSNWACLCQNADGRLRF